MTNNKLIQILKSETIKGIVRGTAALAIPFFGWATLTYSHNAMYDNLCGKQEMCAIASENVSAEILDTAKKTDSITKKAMSPAVYFLASATDVGDKVYRMLNCD